MGVITIGLLIMVLSCSSLGLLMPNSQNGADDTSRQIAVMQEENVLTRQQLANVEAKLQHCSLKIQGIESRLEKVERKQQSVAFFAYRTSSIVNPPSGLTIVFDDVLTDVGAHYDSRHGVFQAPINGTYHFALTASIPITAVGHYVHLHIMKNDQRVTYKFLDGASHSWMGTVTIVLQLKTYDSVSVEVGKVHDTITIMGNGGDGEYHTHFSGFLISAE